MVPTTMKCRLPNVHELFLCIGFSFSGCYSSQQLTQNNILLPLTTLKIQDFSRLLCKIQGFQGLEFGPIKFKAFQDFQGPVQTLISNTRMIFTGSLFGLTVWDTKSSPVEQAMTI